MVHMLSAVRKQGRTPVPLRSRAASKNPGMPKSLQGNSLPDIRSPLATTTFFEGHQSRYAVAVMRLTHRHARGTSFRSNPRITESRCRDGGGGRNMLRTHASKAWTFLVHPVSQRKSLSTKQGTKLCKGSLSEHPSGSTSPEGKGEACDDASDDPDEKT